VKRVLGKKRNLRGRARQVKTSQQNRPFGDPYKYSQDGEVSASEEFPLPLDANFDPDLFQWLNDFEFDNSSEEFVSADDDDDDQPINDPDVGDGPGEWVEDEAGWRHWQPKIDGNDDEDPVERCARLLLEAENFDDNFEQEVIGAREFLTEEEFDRRREEYRERGLRLQREIQQAREEVSPTVWASARKRSPYTPRVTSEVPFLKNLSRLRGQGLKGRKLQFEEHEADPGEAEAEPRPRKYERRKK
jgi:hypothetical protein